MYHEKKHKVIHDFDLSLIADFFQDLDRQGPGNEEITQKVLSFLTNLPTYIKMADIGCGTGGQTLSLARNTTAHITAIDFLPEFTASLQKRVKAAGFEDRISILTESMDNLSFLPGSLDLIWAEGSIYNIGYQRGLNLWRDFLRTDGYIAISEASWFTDERPEEIESFWNANYPEIDTIPRKIEQMQQAGYEPIAHFILPKQAWWDYFDPIRANYDAFLQKHNHSEAAQRLISHFEEEIGLYEKYCKYYGYVFYIGKRFEAENAVTPDFQIRTAIPNDQQGIYRLIQTSFETARVKDGTEQDFAVQLREGKDYIPELELIAESEGQLMGHIMLTKTFIQQPDGTHFEALLLAPLSVVETWRSRGVGAALVRESFRRARKMGYQAVFLAGDPRYYGRFGFRPSVEFQIRSKGDLPSHFVLAMELRNNALNNVSGILDSF